MTKLAFKKKSLQTGYMDEKRIVTKSAKVCIWVSIVLVYLFYSEFLFAFLSNLKVTVLGQRSGIPFSTPRGPKLHPTPEVHYAVAQLHKI